MADTIHIEVVRKACEIVGAQQLADRVKTSHAVVQSWLAGSAPPPRVFLKVLRVIRTVDPTYRPEACSRGATRRRAAVSVSTITRTGLAG